MSNKSTALFLIDVQNDFCKLGGALFVPGADADISRLVRFMGKNLDTIGQIFLTQDNHQVMDISHPAFWIDAEGNHPAPYTQITYADLIAGKWKALHKPEEALEYIHQLEMEKEFPHTIWPEHCIIGSEGAAIVSDVMAVCRQWARKGRFLEFIAKGTHPLTEHFGAFRANIPVPDAPETEFNAALLKKLGYFDRIYLAGEAKSHCVAHTIHQLFGFPGILKKLVLLEDCTSPVPGFEALAEPIYEMARQYGMQFETSSM